MNILCKLGFHRWMISVDSYHLHFGQYSFEKACRRCGLIKKYLNFGEPTLGKTSIIKDGMTHTLREEAPEFTYIIQSWDTAFKDGEEEE